MKRIREGICSRLTGLIVLAVALTVFTGCAGRMERMGPVDLDRTMKRELERSLTPKEAKTVEKHLRPVRTEKPPTVRIEAEYPARPVRRRRCVCSRRIPVGGRETLGEFVRLLRIYAGEVEAVLAPEVKDEDLRKAEVDWGPVRFRTLCEIGETVERQTGFVATVDRSEGRCRLHLGRWVRRSFVVPVAVLEETSGTSIEREGFHVSAQSSNHFRENLERVLADLIGKDGRWVFYESLGRLDVETTPERMVRVERYVRDLVRNLNAAIRVRVTMVRLSRSDAYEFALGWKFLLRRLILKKPWEWGVGSKTGEFVFQGGSTQPREDAYALGYRNLANPDKHALLVNFLRKKHHGVVVDATELYLAQGGTAVFSEGEEREYVSKVETNVVSGETATTSHVSVTKGKLSLGFDVKVQGQADRESGVVTLSLFIARQDLVNLEKVTFSDGTVVQNPDVTVRKQYFTLRVKSGEPVVVAASARRAVVFDRKGAPPLDFLLGERGKSQEGQVVLMILTPTIVTL
ncbi:hypothetical protein [Thermosulfurimonas sp. F29]|uniref:hypothetical protein n=1 Tax=Thermosulfurimonas sp. F29 TaxID=2867247 RepID=UPI001C83A6C5|nr:hypothetical protein [Thermosulfurimonas sp. F29]MBX6423408.1 hypothetical protein [Thermosulfurimonas sp. F29]